MTHYNHRTVTISTGEKDLKEWTSWCDNNLQDKWRARAGHWEWHPDMGGHLRPVYWEFKEANDLLIFLLRWS